MLDFANWCLVQPAPPLIEAGSSSSAGVAALELWTIDTADSDHPGQLPIVLSNLLRQSLVDKASACLRISNNKSLLEAWSCLNCQKMLQSCEAVLGPALIGASFRSMTTTRPQYC